MVTDVQIASVPVQRARPARERRRRRASREGFPVEFFGVVYFLLVILAGGILVWQPARVAEMNQEIATLDSTLQNLKMQSEALRRTVSGIESLDYVEKEARARLGMVSPAEVRTFSVSESSKEITRVASLPKEQPKAGGILSLFGRIAQIFGVKEATAKGQR
jgi:cell division protein FtsB